MSTCGGDCCERVALWGLNDAQASHFRERGVAVVTTSLGLTAKIGDRCPDKDHRNACFIHSDTRLLPDVCRGLEPGSQPCVEAKRRKVLRTGLKK